MKEFRTEIEIKATPEKVWRVLISILNGFCITLHFSIPRQHRGFCDNAINVFGSSYSPRGSQLQRQGLME